MKIIKQVPPDHKKAVEHPDVKVLNTVYRQTLLLWRKAAQQTNIYVVIVFIDVGISVMERIVLPVPDMGTPTSKIQRHGHQTIQPGMLRVGFVPTVVLYIETNRRNG